MATVASSNDGRAIKSLAIGFALDQLGVTIGVHHSRLSSAFMPALLFFLLIVSLIYRSILHCHTHAWIGEERFFKEGANQLGINARPGPCFAAHAAAQNWFGG